MLFETANTIVVSDKTQFETLQLKKASKEAPIYVEYKMIRYFVIAKGDTRSDNASRHNKVEYGSQKAIMDIQSSNVVKPDSKGSYKIIRLLKYYGSQKFTSAVDELEHIPALDHVSSQDSESIVV